jgi:hypothetical protein
MLSSEKVGPPGARRGPTDLLPPPYGGGDGGGEPFKGFNQPIGLTVSRRGSKSKINPEDEGEVHVEGSRGKDARGERGADAKSGSGYIQTASQRHTSANQQLEDFWLPKAQQRGLMKATQGATIGLGDDDDFVDI